MKSLTIRLPDALAKKIHQESIARGLSKSDVVRERLMAIPATPQEHPLADILEEIDENSATRTKRNGTRNKKQLPKIIRAHYLAAKRHYR